MSSSSSIPIPIPVPIAPPQPSPASVTSTTVEGSTTGSRSMSTTAVAAPPSIAGSTTTTTTTTGASSTSSPPPLFPPLGNHHHHHPAQAPAPPQLSVANALHHNQHLIHNPNHGHGPGQGSHLHLPVPVPGPSHTNTGPGAPLRSTTTTSSHPAPHPQPSTQRQIDEARQAVVATLGNMLDRELSGRGAQLHANNAAIEKQEREMGRTLEGFRRDNDKLAKLAAEGGRKIKEIGNVQNWAEMLEREFLILEETLRLVREGDGDGGDGGSGYSGSYSGSGNGSEGSWSGSGSEEGDGDGDREEDGERREREGGGEGVNGLGRANGVNGDERQRHVDGDGDVVMGADDDDDGRQQQPIITTAAGSVIGGSKGKGKERDPIDMALALTEAMETDLVVGEEPSSRSQSQEPQAEQQHGRETQVTGLGIEHAAEDGAKTLPLTATLGVVPEAVALPASPVGSSVSLDHSGPSTLSVGT